MEECKKWGCDGAGECVNVLGGKESCENKEGNVRGLGWVSCEESEDQENTTSRDQEKQVIKMVGENEEAGITVRTLRRDNGKKF